MGRLAGRILAAALVAGGVSACRLVGPGSHEAEPAPALPPIPVYEIAPRTDSGIVLLPTERSRDPLANVPRDRRVTLTSSNADARTLLLWLAQQADVNVVVSQDVRARVSVNFREVPVADAIRAVIAESGLSFLVGDELSPWPPVVFYQLPVNINTASAETIAARFGVSLALARWMVETRMKP